MMIPFLTQSYRPEQHFAQTSDGWRIALYRYRRATARGTPVFLCHGLGANRYNLDGPGRTSLARWLMDQGFDVWLIELRGAGASSRPTWRNDLRYDWYFDHYVRYDVPAALDLIRGLTGHEDVHWVGHSMGGMVAYAYCIEQAPERVRSIIAIGSPSFTKLGNGFFDHILGLKPLLDFFPKVPYERSGWLVIPVMPLFKETFGRLFANPRNLRTRDLMQLIAFTPSGLPTSLISQLANWYEGGGFSAELEDTNYCQALSTVTNPTLVVAGAADLLTPVPEMQFVFDSLGGDENVFLLLGRSTGCRHDYGHIDLVLGRYAPTEVWPHIDAFIREHMPQP